MKFGSNPCLCPLPLVLVLLMLAVADTHAATLSTGSMRDAVLARNDDFKTAFNTLSPSRIVSMYAPTARAQFPGFDPIVGRDALSGAYTGLFQTAARVEFTRIQVSRSGSDYLTKNTYLVTEFRRRGPALGPATVVLSQRTGTITLTWQLRGRTWFIVSDVTTSD